MRAQRTSQQLSLKNDPDTYLSSFKPLKKKGVISLGLIFQISKKGEAKKNYKYKNSDKSSFKTDNILKHRDPKITSANSYSC